MPFRIAEDIIEPNGRESTIDARQLQATSPKSDDSKNKEIYEIRQQNLFVARHAPIFLRRTLDGEPKFGRPCTKYFW